MSYAATLYVTAGGSVYGASQTDQAGTKKWNGRTVNGEPAICIGSWWGSQMSWAPYAKAVDAGRIKTQALSAEVSA